MAIVNHPLAAMELGEFIEHKIANVAPEGETANWVCFFCYNHGIVRQEAINNGRDYRYQTFLDKSNQNIACLFDNQVVYLDDTDERVTETA